jgi:hypothetical protein
MASYTDDTFTGLAHEGNIDGIRNLLQNPNGYSNIEDDEGGIGHEGRGRAMTALGIAARRGDLAMMDLLLGEGSANPNGTGSFDNYYCATPLFAAVQGRHFEAVVKLLDAGADVDGSESMHPNTRGGETAMYYAAEHNDLAMATLLHRYGACLCIPTARGHTPLDIATVKGHIQFASWIKRMSTHFVPDMLGGGTNYKLVLTTARPRHDEGMASIVE